MVENRSVRLDVSTDADFFPVLKESVADFAHALEASGAVLADLEVESERMLQKLKNFNGSDVSITLELGENCSLETSAV